MSIRAHQCYEIRIQITTAKIQRDQNSLGKLRAAIMLPAFAMRFTTGCPVKIELTFILGVRLKKTASIPDLSHVTTYFLILFENRKRARVSIRGIEDNPRLPLFEVFVDVLFVDILVASAIHEGWRQAVISTTASKRG